MNIRNLEEKDIPECLDIYNYYIENTSFTLEEDPLTLEEFSKRLEDIAKRYPFLVLEENNHILGYAYLNTFNPRSAYRYTADLSIYISKDHLHEHLGKLLLDAIEEAAIARGITNIISIVTDKNQNSLSFHERNGFLLEGHIHDVAKKFNRILGVYYLRKPLSR